MSLTNEDNILKAKSEYQHYPINEIDENNVADLFNVLIQKNRSDESFYSCAILLEKIKWVGKNVPQDYTFNSYTTLSYNELTKLGLMYYLYFRTKVREKEYRIFKSTYTAFQNLYFTELLLGIGTQCEDEILNILKDITEFFNSSSHDSIDNNYYVRWLEDAKLLFGETTFLSYSYGDTNLEDAKQSMLVGDFSQALSTSNR